MAFRISFFRTPQHRVFDYKPRYYDPDKEEFQERVEQSRLKYQEEARREDKPYIPGASIRGSFKRNHEQKRAYPKNANLIRWITIVALILIMLAAVYFSNIFSVILDRL